MKVCSKCKIKKLFLDFNKKSSSSDGRSSQCRDCIKNGRYKYKESKRKSDKKYYEANKDKFAEAHKQWTKKNPEKMNAYREKWAANNPDKQKESKLKWDRANKDRKNKTNKLRSKYRYHTDEKYKLVKIMRAMFYRVIFEAKFKKTSKMKDIVNYSANDLRIHIENKFIDGMRWNNHGDWHIDHIKPIAQFLKEGITDPVIINALDNLQPLWAKDNMSKGDKYVS